MSRSAILLGSILLLPLLAPMPTHAAGTKTFIALLNGGQETPPQASTAFGVAFLTLGTDKKLCYSLTYQGLQGTEVAAHLHGPAEPGVAGPIILPLVAGNPKNGDCLGPLSGPILKALKKGQTYVNVHSSVAPNGEIRGQVVATH